MAKRKTITAEGQAKAAMKKADAGKTTLTEATVTTVAETVVADTLAPLEGEGVKGTDIITTDDQPDIVTVVADEPNKVAVQVARSRTQAEIDLDVLAEAQTIRQTPERFRAAKVIAGNIHIG